MSSPWLGPQTIEVKADPAYLEQIARIAGFAFFILDENDRIVYWGESARGMFGSDSAVVLEARVERPNYRGVSLPAASAHGGAEVTILVNGECPQVFRRFFVERFEGGIYRGGIEILTPVATDTAKMKEPVFTRHREFAASLVEARRAIAAGLPVHLEGEPGSEVIDVIHWLFPDVPLRIHPAAALDAASLARLLAEPAPGVHFIEDVEDLSPAAQRVLRSLLQQRFGRGEGGQLASPVALVTASSHGGAVSPDLIHLLATLKVVIPPLRERPQDIEPAVHAALARFPNPPREISKVEPEALGALARYGWPGNIDELNVVIFRAVLRGEGTLLRYTDLSDDVKRAPKAVSRRNSKPDAARERIRGALDDADGSVALAADALGISRSTLWRHRRRLGL